MPVFHKARINTPIMNPTLYISHVDIDYNAVDVTSMDLGRAVIAGPTTVSFSGEILGLSNDNHAQVIHELLHSSNGLKLNHLRQEYKCLHCGSPQPIHHQHCSQCGAPRGWLI